MNTTTTCLTNTLTANNTTCPHDDSPLLCGLFAAAPTWLPVHCHGPRARAIPLASSVSVPWAARPRMDWQPPGCRPSQGEQSARCPVHQECRVHGARSSVDTLYRCALVRPTDGLERTSMVVRVRSKDVSRINTCTNVGSAYTRPWTRPRKRPFLQKHLFFGTGF
jgi:hypothetical protein